MYYIIYNGKINVFSFKRILQSLIQASLPKNIKDLINKGYNYQKFYTWSKVLS